MYGCVANMLCMSVVRYVIICMGQVENYIGGNLQNIIVFIAANWPLKEIGDIWNGCNL